MPSRRRFVFTMELIVALLQLFACSVPRSHVTAVTHVTVIDATGVPPQADFTVCVSGSQIFAVGLSSSVPMPRDAQVIDGTGKFLIPGLADMRT
jgi:imidazolonepropionase-like amidohydrolase